MAEPGHSDPRGKLRSVLELLLLLLGFSISLSLLITILVFGLGILIRGAKVCQASLYLGEYEWLLRSPCSCAWVEVLLLALAVPVLLLSAPRLLQKLIFYREKFLVRLKAKK